MNGNDYGCENDCGGKGRREDEFAEQTMRAEDGDGGDDDGGDEGRGRTLRQTGCPRKRILANALWNRGQFGVARMREGVGQTDVSESRALRFCSQIE